VSNTIRPATDAKQHFEILDGLRGVAALCVVLFHFMEWIYSDPADNFIGHGFLAVDFFFCLSGFVIGYAYDDRMRNIGVIAFLKSRLIRLHPLVIAGSILGLTAFLFDPFVSSPGIYTAGKTLLIFICSMLLIPLPVMADRGYNLFGLNAPSWSLFWEYVASIGYALILYKLKRHYIIILTVISGIGICIVCCRAGNLLGGWSGPTFWDGGLRVSYSFLAGLLVYRSKFIVKNNLGFVGLSLLLVVAFLIPYSQWNWIVEPLIVLFYFPFLVALGAGSSLNPGLKNVCVLSGMISYPLYMTHYALLWIFGNYYTNYKPNAVSLVLIITGGFIFVIGLAYLVMLKYDIPLRRYLKKPVK